MELSLPLSESEQESIIGHALTDFNFFLKCKKNLKKNWFTINPLIGVLFDQLCKIHSRDGLFIKSIKEFKDDFFFQELTPQDRVKYFNLIDRCIHSSQEFTLERTRKKLTGFIRTSYFKESIEGAAARYKSNGLDSAYDWTKKKLEEIKDASFEDNVHVMNFNDATTWITKARERRESAFSTGSKNLDKVLGGGLFRGETIGVMSPSNQGKTRFLTTLARHLIKQQLHVMFFIHEGSPSMVREQIMCSFLAVSRERLFQMIEHPETRKVVNTIGDYINEYLTFVPYITVNSMYVEDVLQMALDFNDQLKNRTGKGYDVVINDYPKKLKSRASQNSREQLNRVSIGNIYDAFNPLSIEMDANVIYAIQTNRSGSRQNNGSVPSANLLSSDEADESFSIVQTSAAIITLNRSPEDKKNDILRICVVKSRNSEVDVTVNTRTSYKTSVLFGDKDMLNNGGLWETDINNGFLESYIQDTNKKEESGVVDAALRIKAGSLQKDDSDNNGVYISRSEIED